MGNWSRRISLTYLRALLRWQVFAPVYLVLLFGYYGLTGLFSLPRRTGLGLQCYLLFCAVFLCVLHRLIFAGRSLARWRCAARLVLFTGCLFPLWMGLMPFLGLSLRAGLVSFAALLLAVGVGTAIYEGFSRIRGRRYDRQLRDYQARRAAEHRQ